MNNSVYDDDIFFEKYIQKRQKGDSPNDTIEKPIINDLVGNIAGNEVLDLGCGDANYGLELLKNGAKYYHGIDNSVNMLKLAELNLKGLNHKLTNMNIVDFKFQQYKYDIIISRLVLHYIENLEPLLVNIYNSLKDKGVFVCSMEHPIITSCSDSYMQKIKRQNWIVDNYFNSGERNNLWLEKEVIKYHKTIEEYFTLFKNAGFKISDIRESKPCNENFKSIEEYERRMKIPLFILFRLNK